MSDIDIIRRGLLDTDTQTLVDALEAATRINGENQIMRGYIRHINHNDEFDFVAAFGFEK